MKLLSLTILYLLFFCFRLSAAGEYRTPQTIRIAVLKGMESVRVDGNGLIFTDNLGRKIDVQAPVKVRSDGSGISIEGSSMSGLTVTAPEGTRNVVTVNGKGYRGTVEIRPQGKGLVIINDLALEDYLVGVINCEISSQWSIEAIKAQAVVARSYAVFQRDSRKNLPYHLESSVLDQVYQGCDLDDSRAARGVRETAGEVLTYGGKGIQAFFHSSCGGHTEASENVWTFGTPYLAGVDCKYCLTSPSAEWTLTISLAKLEGILEKGGYKVRGLRGMILLSRNRSGRVESLSILYDQGSLNIPAVDFRKTVGYGVVKSTNFEVRMSGTDVVLTGRGYGHGVGLCQWGAKKRAEDGFSYREILSYYYPGTVLKKLY